MKSYVGPHLAHKLRLLEFYEPFLKWCDRIRDKFEIRIEDSWGKTILDLKHKGLQPELRSEISKLLEKLDIPLKESEETIWMFVMTGRMSIEDAHPFRVKTSFASPCVHVEIHEPLRKKDGERLVQLVNQQFSSEHPQLQLQDKKQKGAHDTVKDVEVYKKMMELLETGKNMTDIGNEIFDPDNKSENLPIREQFDAESKFIRQLNFTKRRIEKEVKKLFSDVKI